MKKIIALLTVVLALSSCTLNNDEPNFSYKIVPVSAVKDMPTKFAVDSITKITLTYVRPSTCYFFNDFSYETDGFTRTVGIGTIVKEGHDCQADNVTAVDVVLKFKPLSTGTYNFKFWAGKSSAGVDQYLEKTATVTH